MTSSMLSPYPEHWMIPLQKERQIRQHRDSFQPNPCCLTHLPTTRPTTRPLPPRSTTLFTSPPIPDPLHLTFNTAPHPTLRPDLGLDLLCFKRFIDPACSWDLTNYLLSALPWHRVKYTVRGNSINTPRWTTVFGKGCDQHQLEGDTSVVLVLSHPSSSGLCRKVCILFSH